MCSFSNIRKSLYKPRGLLLLILGLLSFSTLAMDCPVTPTQYLNVSIPNPDPAPEPGEFPADLTELMSYVAANNISNVKELIDHMPLHLRKHYSFIKNTAALNETSLQNPGLLPWGSDSRFMMNIGTIPSAALYEVVDIAYLQEDGDWEFRSLDFRGATPEFSPPGGNGGECRQCHGPGGNVNGSGPLRPFLGNYLFWTGFFSDSNGASGEDVTAEEKPILDAIKNGQHNNDRWHRIIAGDYLYAEIGTSNMLPDHAYGPGLTIFNTEMASAVAESIHKRMSRSNAYAGMREEMLALSYCDGKGQLSNSEKNDILDFVESQGGDPRSFISYNSWAGVYQALGLDPMHELPLHFRTQDLGSATEQDMNWNTGVSALREVVDFLIIMELASENSTLNNMLSNYQSSYSMTSGCSFNSLKEHFDHKMYALFTLKGNARQKARESYYDIDYVRIHASMNNITSQFCNLLTNNIGSSTIGNPNTGGSSSGGSSSGGSSSGGSSSGGSSSGGSSSGGSSSGGSSSGGNVLQNGVPVSGLSASTGNHVVYSINVPSGASNLVIQISGGSGDADLYTRAGAVPTDNTYACRPYAGGNSETCTEPNPTATTWYARVKAYQTFSGVTLTASYNGGGSSSGGSSSGGSSSGGSSSGGSSSGGSSSGGSSSGGSSSGGSSSGGSSSGGSSSGGSSSGGSSSGGNVLQNGVPVSGLSASTGNHVVYSINVPSGASNLVIQISGGSGDADLYTRAGAVPTDNTYACRPYAGGNSETCTEPNPTATTWYARVKAYQTFSGVTLTASYNGGGSSSGGSSSGGSSSGGSSSGGSSSGGSSSGGSSSGGSSSGGSSSGGSSSGGSSSGGSSSGAITLGNGVPITGISGASGSVKNYFIHVHGGAPSNLVITTSGGSGDVDLYVKQGAMPTTSDYDCRPYIGGNSETCTFNSPVHGPYFIMLRGYNAYSGVTLSGSYNEGGSSSGGSSSGGSSSGGSSSGGNSEEGLVNACSMGRPAQSNTNIALGEAICTQNAGSGQVNFRYTPTSSDVGQDIMFTIGHGNGVAGLTANQDFNGYATEADYNANPNTVYGSFGFDPLNQRRTYNFVIVPNVQANKDIWISLNAGNGGFSGVALKGEVLVPVDTGNLPNACAAGSPPITDQYVTLGQAVCGQSSQGPGFYTHFIYRPTASEAGRDFLLEMGHGSGNANMTANQHYSDAPTSGGTAFAHEEHLSDRPDLVYMSFRPGVEQRVIVPNAQAQKDILVVVPPGPNGFSNFTFRMSVLP